MPRLPECDRCLYSAHHYTLVCSLHPAGVEGDNCPDYEPNPEVAGKRFVDFLGLSEYSGLNSPIDNPYSLEPKENWAPEGTRFVNGELVIDRNF